MRLQLKSRVALRGGGGVTYVLQALYLVIKLENV